MPEERRESERAASKRIEAALDRITVLLVDVKKNTETIRAQLHLNVNFLQGVQAPMFDIKDEVARLALATQEIVDTLQQMRD